MSALPLSPRIELRHVRLLQLQILRQRVKPGLRAQPARRRKLGARTSARATIMATARSRCRDGCGASRLSRPNRLSVPSTAATCPCGRLRSISCASPAGTSLSPRSARRSTSIASGGSIDPLSVSLQTAANHMSAALADLRVALSQYLHER
jgi:hypothetical protein